MRKLALLAIVAAFCHACGGSDDAVGEIDFGVRFMPSGYTDGIDCQAANVARVHFLFYAESEDKEVKAEVSHPCAPDEHFRITLDTGTYSVLVQGFNDQEILCYESVMEYTVEEGLTDGFSLVAEEHPLGAQNGCVFP